MAYAIEAEMPAMQSKPSPASRSNTREVDETVNYEELAAVKRARPFTETKVAPVSSTCWKDDPFPF